MSTEPTTATDELCRRIAGIQDALDEARAEVASLEDDRRTAETELLRLVQPPFGLRVDGHLVSVYERERKGRAKINTEAVEQVAEVLQDVSHAGKPVVSRSWSMPTVAALRDPKVAAQAAALGIRTADLYDEGTTVYETEVAVEREGVAS